MASFLGVEDSMLRIHAGQCVGRHDKLPPKHMEITPERGSVQPGPDFLLKIWPSIYDTTICMLKERIDKHKEHTNPHFNSSQFGKALSTYTRLSNGPNTQNPSGPYDKDTLKSVLVQTNNKDQHSRTDHTEASKWTRSLGIRLMQLLMALKC